MARILAVLVMMFAAPVVWAAAPPGESAPEEPPGIARFHAFSEGATLCSDVIRAIESERANRPPGYDYERIAFDMPYVKLVFWMDGYLTAENELDPEHRMVGRSLGFQSRMRWIEGYCRNTPYEVFVHAVSAMRLQMIEEGR